jgi:hypothetical protein
MLVTTRLFHRSRLEGRLAGGQCFSQLNGQISLTRRHHPQSGRRSAGPGRAFPKAGLTNLSRQQLPIPNAANLQAAVNGMTAEGNNIVQSVQTYNAYQQALNTDLSLCANYNVAQMQQQLAVMQANVAAIRTIQASLDVVNAW